MLHPDSHNMFDNGSFLRRRRRFKQEGANGGHRNQQQGGGGGGGGGRQRGQLHQRCSPNSVSPASSATQNALEQRPTGGKSSRSRNHASNSGGKATITDETDCSESPRKVGDSDRQTFSLSLLFIRNMPVDTLLQKWSQSKPVNRVITFQLTDCHLRKHHRSTILSPQQCQVSISSIRWPWQRQCTTKQVAHPPALRIPPTRPILRQRIFDVQIRSRHPVQFPWRQPMQLHLRIIHHHQHWMETTRATIFILIITDRMAQRRTTITMVSICIHPILITAARQSLPPTGTGRTPLNPTSPAQPDSTWVVNPQHRVLSPRPECLTPRHPHPNKISPITLTDLIHTCRKWLEPTRPVTNSISNTMRNTVEVSSLSLFLWFFLFFSFSNVDSVCACVFTIDLTLVYFKPLFSKCAPISCFVMIVFVRARSSLSLFLSLCVYLWIHEQQT